MWGRVHTNANSSPFPVGYKFKTGSLATSELSKGVYIPLEIYVDFRSPGEGGDASSELWCYSKLGNKNVATVLKINEIISQGRQYARVVGTFSLMNTFAYDFDTMKSITGFSHGVNITAWLEKIGGN